MDGWDASASQSESTLNYQSAMAIASVYKMDFI